jgi:hypothetical protein
MLGDCPTIGVILIQILTGFVGSLIAGFLIAVISEKRFNRAVKMSESNITSALDPINKIVFTIAEKTKRLPELVPTVSAIGNEIKSLTTVVDKMREGLEKTK